MNYFRFEMVGYRSENIGYCFSRREHCVYKGGIGREGKRYDEEK
jgi:hypothetical protein